MKVVDLNFTLTSNMSFWEKKLDNLVNKLVDGCKLLKTFVKSKMSKTREN